MEESSLEGDWVACLDWERTGSGAPDCPRFGQDRDSDAIQVANGKLCVLLAGLLDESGDRVRQAARLLDSYEREGESCFPGLRGRFAALIWDGAQRRLVALRDPMGIYPLFFGRTSRGMILSPSLARLRAAGVGAISRIALAEHVLHRWPEKGQTYFEGLRRIPAGHLLKATETGDRLARYWDPALPGKPDGVDWLEPGELARFDELFSRSVQRYARTERPGIFLSGGLDSVSIASCLSEGRSERKRPLALSLAFDHSECDELVIQTGVAASLGLEHEIQRVAARTGDLGPLERAAELTSGWPVPLMNVWNGEFFRLAQSGRKRGCDLILTGSGGDDWLGVSPYYAADLLRAGRLVTLARLTGSLRKSFGMSVLSAARVVVWRFGARALLRQAVSAGLGRFAPAVSSWVWRRRVERTMPRWLAPGGDLRRELFERARSSPNGPAGSSFYVREMRRGLDHPLIALELEESFEIGRRLGLKLVHPFFDPDLVAFLYRAPPRLLVGEGGPDRQLVRAMLETKFPGLGFERLRKSDARAFFGDLAAKEGARLWRELGGARELGKLGIVDTRGVQADVGTMLSNPSSNLFRLWDLINLERWLRGQTADSAS